MEFLTVIKSRQIFLQNLPYLRKNSIQCGISASLEIGDIPRKSNLEKSEDMAEVRSAIDVIAN